MKQSDSALVVGASGHVGRAVVSEAVNRGLNVIAASRSPVASAAQSYVELDIENDESVACASERIPRLDLAVFAQGAPPSTNLQQSPRRHVRSMLESHVIGTIACLKAMRDKLNEGACIVLFSSIAARKGSYDPTYSAAKGAVESLTRSLARELRDRARVVCLAPGLIENSPVHKSMHAEHVAAHTRRMFGRRLIDASHVAQLVLHVFDNPAINAAVIPVDGGYWDP